VVDCVGFEKKHDFTFGAVKEPVDFFDSHTRAG
jgi:hypothetical protein